MNTCRIGLILTMLYVANTTLAAYPDDLKLTTYNAMLLPRSAYPNYGQVTRAQQIADAAFLQHQDVVVLQELFDNTTSEDLLNRLSQRFPYHTPVIGRSRSGWSSTEGGWRDTAIEDGGVAIASKWPIVEKVQYLFRTIGCGDDYPSLKGFAYAKLNANGQYYHIIGTHAQSESSWGCGGRDGHAAVRQAQFKEIADWIKARRIPSTEMVLIAGDMNVNKANSNEYQTMLRTLNAHDPHYVGVPHTFDTVGNGLALERYGARSGDPVEYLDYVFVERNHRQPSFWHNLAIDPASPQWRVQAAGNGRTYTYTDLSDHYPVMAFARADNHTPTHSYADQAGSYRAVTFKNLGNNHFMQAATQADGWLKADGKQDNSRTRFNLSNNFAMRDNGCIQSGEYVRVERADLPGHFWTWYGLAGSYQYAYYTKQGPLNADPELRLLNLSRPTDCLQDGDIVAFRDWAHAADYYMTAWNGGWANDWLYLWSASMGPREQFQIKITTSSMRLDWRDQLVY
ncbi:sphingomyelin phosphodiesterase [Chitinivorax sp. B]|uniref:sphingomyelin phosphodiesterase n=1 Tax=Chitinivorax sp. B TaxID=2502235 RepID=UPI0014855FDD|nr:sphingomyelin phosphodiesterase [Chitinivorax sp. B]